MGIERPKILTAVTIPSGGYNLKCYEQSPTTNAFTTAIPAGDYFIAWDGQSDDLLWKISDLVTTDLRTAQGAGSGVVRLFLDSDHKVNIRATGLSNTLRIAWTEEDGATLAGILGIDGSADDDLTNNSTLTAGDHHPYGWYADEDGYLEMKPVFDTATVDVIQARSYGGIVKTLQYSDQLYQSMFSMFAMTNAKTWSNGVAYKTTQTDPNRNTNEPLECWFQEATQGIRFRFYRNDATTVGRMEQIASSESSNTSSTVTYSGTSLTVDGLIGKMVYISDASDGVACRWYVSDNTATVVTAPNAWRGVDMTSTGEDWYLVDGSYGTYVLDMRQGMPVFAPQELPGLDRFSVSYNLLKYET